MRARVKRNISRNKHSNTLIFKRTCEIFKEHKRQHVTEKRVHVSDTVPEFRCHGSDGLREVTGMRSRTTALLEISAGSDPVNMF